MGGETTAVTYEQVCAGGSGHIEVVEVLYDPSRVSYADLLQVFFDNHNPTTPNQQGPNRGVQYSSAIFTYSDQQVTEATEFIEALQESARWPNPIVTVIRTSEKFWRAEEYHQDYYAKKGITPACKLK